MRNLSRLVGALLLWGCVFSSVSYAVSTAAAQSSSADSDYAKRMQRLEEQIVDLNAQIGAIESLARGAGGGGGMGAANGTGTGGDESRLGQMEMEVRALSAQVGDLARRLQAMEQRMGMAPQQPFGEQGTGFVIGGDGSASSGTGTSTSASGGFSGSARIEPAPAPVPEPEPAPPPKKKKSSGFLGLFGSDDEEETPPPPQNVQPRASAPEPANAAPVRVASASSGDAKTMYETAYSALMRRNYREAADGFEAFLKSYPSDPLAGSAHFWLGEAAFTNGEYRKAADNFLKCTSNYPQSDKAAESMLKLGISLKRLNEKDAACSSFNELSRRYPNATAVLQRAESEKRRTGC